MRLSTFIPRSVLLGFCAAALLVQGAPAAAETGRELAVVKVQAAKANHQQPNRAKRIRAALKSGRDAIRLKNLPQLPGKMWRQTKKISVNGARKIAEHKVAATVLGVVGLGTVVLTGSPEFTDGVGQAGDWLGRQVQIGTENRLDQIGVQLAAAKASIAETATAFAAGVADKYHTVVDGYHTVANTVSNTWHGMSEWQKLGTGVGAGALFQKPIRGLFKYGVGLVPRTFKAVQKGFKSLKQRRAAKKRIRIPYFGTEWTEGSNDLTPAQPERPDDGRFTDSGDLPDHVVAHIRREAPFVDGKAEKSGDTGGDNRPASANRELENARNKRAADPDAWKAKVTAYAVEKELRTLADRKKLAKDSKGNRATALRKAAHDVLIDKGTDWAIKATPEQLAKAMERKSGKIVYEAIQNVVHRVFEGTVQEEIQNAVDRGRADTK
jgi:hypothetical protein